MIPLYGAGGGEGAVSFTDLSDAPAYGTAYALVRADDTPDALVFSAIVSDIKDALISSSAKAIGTGVTNIGGLEFTSTTPATAGAQEHSPPIISGGQGWKTDATAASVAVSWQTQTVPVQGAAAPSVNRIWQSKVGAGSATTQMTLTSAGQLTAVGPILGTIFAPSVRLAAAGVFQFFPNSANFDVEGVTNDAVYTDQNKPVVFGGAHASRDSAGAIVSALGYFRNAAVLTNAATMFNADGWTDNADTFHSTHKRYYNGDLGFNVGLNGQESKIQSLTELTTIDAAAFTDTTITIPAESICIGVSTYVETVVPVTTSFDVGIVGATTRYGSTISTAATTSDTGTDDALRAYAAATAVRITTSAGGNPDAATGKIRVTIHYITIIPPTS